MKREAMDTLRVHAMDRHGNPVPMASAVAYEVRSVAVPWGNCVEPSNVRGCSDRLLMVLWLGYVWGRFR